MAKIIYIISTGHSGSTLLDILLGTFPNVFSTGEFRYFTWQIYRTMNGEGSIENQDVCTCGKRFQECNVWSKVIDKLNNSEGLNIYEDPLSFNTSPLINFKYNAKTNFVERIIGKLIKYEMYHLKIKVFSKWFNKYYIKEVENVWKLVDTIGEVTGSEYIVDSTKDILRYYLLKQYRPNDIFLIINEREIRGFAYSMQKLKERKLHFEDSFKLKKKYLKKINLLIKNVPSNYIRTTYDSFVKNPENFLSNVANWLNIFFTPEQLTNINTKNYHLIAGNPMRYNGKIKIKYDNKWEKKLNYEQKQELYLLIKKYKLK